MLKLKKYIFLLIVTLLSSFAVYANDSEANEKNIEGILQAYWFPAVNDDGSEGKSELMLRFLDGSSQTSPKVIDLFKTKNREGLPENSNFTDARTIALIKKEFIAIPDNFFRFKEGHIEQAGSLTLSSELENVECDNKNYYAHFISFKATASGQHNAEDIARRSGCGGYPWLQRFSKNLNKETVTFKSQPDAKSKVVYTVTTDDTVVKIKSINAEWIYAAIYDESKPEMSGNIRGYILKSDLSLLN
ncbi:hypothetical protein [Erwinia pyrifoliae]|uniref:SH3 domain-containing protein n=1 Tax=Erwinia pyrifoliae TaxID=79967 RepID=A0ABY5X691_ERWPY|nr:hypothetical protein [Erwinia pyrifoliae]AUX73789.1 hypothetical protein CPI84_15740 [Erwinia pyrifoliae]MCA8875889.1 hypothetical protein [Erwinia pyrifoliae]MCT2387687.1 hypothetical protein [Erwinia pyrifoliae]MCU8585943.1 hypothetical protein [Erwinia pyrifoliae]UWS32905.1 hypothetical protein NYP84_14995 [Erwinia pyrifoliae]